MSCSLDAPRGADFLRRYIFPEIQDLTGYPCVFNVYEAVGGALLLSVIAISNANGSETLSLGNILTVNITKEDLALLPVSDDPTVPALLRYDLLLTSPDETVTDKLAGGLFRVLPTGFSYRQGSDDIVVSLGGEDIDVTIDGGAQNLSYINQQVNQLQAQIDLSSAEIARLVALNVNLESYVLPGDSGNYKLAIDRILASYPQNVVINLRPGVVYNHTPVTIDRDGVWFSCPAGQAAATFNLTTSAQYQFDVGGTSAVRANVYFQSITFTRSLANHGAVEGDYSATIRFRNIFNFGCDRCYVYGDNKADRWLELKYVLYGTFDGNYSQNLTREHVWALGGTNNPGTLGMRCQDVWFSNHKAAGSHLSTPSPQDQGVFVLEDCCQAFKWRNVQVYDHCGYGLYMKGTLANRSINTICRAYDLDVEAGHAFAGTVRVDNFVGCLIQGGWSDGRGAASSGGGINMAACRAGVNSQNCTFDFPNMNTADYDVYAGWDEGVNNTFSITVSGDASRSEGGYLIDTTALRGRYFGAVDQMRYVVKNSAAANAGHTINIQFDTVGAALQTGLSAANNYRVDFQFQGTTTQFVTSATTTTLGGTLAEYQINLGATPIDNLALTHDWYGREFRLRLVDVITVRDAAASAGNITLGVSGVPFASTGRGMISFSRDAASFREISRNG
jgi:hypothetical protein